MYSRIGNAAYKTDMTNTILLCELLDHPEEKFKSIHIAGTNGKGSTSHMLAAILQECGYKTGLYTSPHLKDFRERIRINGKMISKKYVTDFVEKHNDKISEIGCSFFEWTVGLAFDYFATEEVDIAIVETGLGGRLDSTNIITPLLSIITNISYDHTELLGDTIAKIAFEKAGIIKDDVPVVIGERQTGVEDIFIASAKAKKSPITFATDNWVLLSVEWEIEKQQLLIKDLHGDPWKITTDLLGNYQEKNLLTVLEACRILIDQGFTLEKEKVIHSLARVKELTQLRGRWDILSLHPLIIADVAHNEAGLKYSLEQLKSYSYKNLHFVIGFVKEKEISKILQLFPNDAYYYFCRPDIPRGLDVHTLKQSANEFGLRGEEYSSVSKAFDAAKRNASENDLIYAGGSTFVVAEVI
jgi:dihydrofolate synthase/folylpolyglutamate synthase